MTSSATTKRKPVAPQRLAEAGVWISRLHGGARSRAMENGLRRWLHEDPENARAFELATDVWDDAEKLRRFVSIKQTVRVTSRPRWNGLVAAGAFGVLMVVAGLVLFQQLGVITTAIGEQRQVVLQDGTRVFLNTDTRIAVKYDEATRRVELRRGEALFNVAKQSDWPFIVVAGDRQVRALGTSFVVRKDEQRVAVILVEGKVSISPTISSGAGEAAVVDQPRADAAPAAQLRKDIFTLSPGQRLTFTNGAATRLDMPSVDKTTAWRRGQVILDDTPLRAAADEMNRYNTVQLVVEHPDAAGLLINGLFQAGDSAHFANAVAQAYGLEVIERGDAIVLAGQPDAEAGY